MITLTKTQILQILNDPKFTDDSVVWIHSNGYQIVSEYK